MYAIALSIADVSATKPTALNLLVLLGLSWFGRNRPRLGILLAAVLVAPTLATIATIP